VTWAQEGFPENYHFYDLTAHKEDGTVYLKLQHRICTNWHAFEDFQVRSVRYRINGFSDNPSLIIDKQYLFINPKAGITYNRNNIQGYFSYSVGSKEPNRDDFEAGKNQQPKPETLHDIELGLEKRMADVSFGATFYYMYYHNQLVLTGKINDVGAYTRTNTPSSYRMGVELLGKMNFNQWLKASANMTLSKNKIKNFTEYVDDYDNGKQQSFQYHNTNISFSPEVIIGGTLTIVPIKDVSISMLSKYVGRQFLDNTSKKSRSLSGFYVQDLGANYTLRGKLFKDVSLTFLLKNVFDKKYEPNGYTFSYYNNGMLNTENFYFPMAGRNFMAGINIRI
jgi:iron complex outermembrane receptor protein